MPPRRRARSRLQNAGWSALLTFSLLGITEIFFRLFLPKPDLDGIALDYNADLMWDLSARAGPHLQINSLGLRGPELQPDGGAPRLLSLGDSSVFGDGVNYDEVFTTVAAAALTAAGTPVEPVIGAVPGYSSFQTIRQFARLSDTVKPAVVVIGAMWSDAIRHASTDAEEQLRLAQAYASWRPVYALLRWPSEHSAAMAWMQGALHDRLKARYDELGQVPPPGRIGWITDAAPAPPPGPPGATPPPPHAGDPQALTQRKDDELAGGVQEPGVARVPPESYRANLLTLVADTQAAGAQPMLLLLPHPRDDAGQDLPARYQSYRDTMRAVAAESGVPLVDAERWFEANPCGCSRFSDDIHPNAAGHAGIARALLEVIHNEGLLAAP